MPVFFKTKGFYIGVEPGTRLVYTNRPEGKGWEGIRILPAHSKGRVIAHFIDANVVLSVQPDGRLETREAGTMGEYEELTLVPFMEGVQAWRQGVGPVFDVEGYVTPTEPLPALRIRENDFIDRAGQRIAFCGCDGFDDYRFWLDGREDKVMPFMKECNDYGFTARRIFLAGAAIENQVFDLYPDREPSFYPELVPFVRFENAHGIIPLLTVNVDMQRVMPMASDRLRNWRTINGELRGKDLAYIISGGNQHDKNGWDPYDDTEDPGADVIWSRGSNTENLQTPPRGAPASELHATRISWDRTLMDAVASPPNMREVGQSTLVMMTEGMPFDQNTDPRWGWRLGRAYSIDWAVSVFHDRQGQRGLLRTDNILRSFEQWGKGARL
jgi:hypothetical protein